MARQPRLSLPGIAHLVVQRGHDGGAIARDDADAQRLVHLLRECAAASGVLLHAYGLEGPLLQVLATPDSSTGISTMMQSLGRHYATAFNRRHGRTGALWEGRFRSALVAPGAALLLALRMVDATGATVPAAASGPGHDAGPMQTRDLPAEAGLSSAAGRTGGRRDPALVDPPEYWQLGNTPFERETRYAALLAEPVDSGLARALLSAVQAGRAYGPPEFLHDLSQRAARPMTPRPRGRPRRQA